MTTRGRPREHHRIFWRDETTSSSMWAGAHKATTTASSDSHGQKLLPQHDTEDTSAIVIRSQEEGQADQLLEFDYSRTAAATVDSLRQISTRSDLEYLYLLLESGKIDAACPETIAAAVREGNPAVLGVLLCHGVEHCTSYMKKFRTWSQTYEKGRSRPLCLPLHIACHLGSHGVTSVLLEFLHERCTSNAEREEMVNARDSRGRTALHKASWSPRSKCPGKRHATIRCKVPNSTSQLCKNDL